MKLILVSMTIAVFSMNGCSLQKTHDNHNESNWVALFNGNDLTGWTSHGEIDAWGVENGELVTLKPGKGWWIRTKKMYRDFELKLEFWIPKGGNSGVGIRGSSNGDPAFTGFEVQILDTYGQEPANNTCGSVYTAITASKMAVHPAGEWNTYHIKVVGDKVSVILNGVNIMDAEPLDDRGYFRSPENPLPLNARATTGYISLQDHGHAFRFRNIKIKDLSPDPEPTGMVSLIELENWFPEDSAQWSNEGGSLIGYKGPGHLFTNTSYTNFELRALVKVNTNGNSGIYFRAKPNPDPDVPWPIGYEAQVDNNSPKNFTGAIYDRAWPKEIDAAITRDDAWFDYRIRAEGDHISTWINGQLMVDTVLNEYDSGHIAVQGHHAENVIEFRDIRIIELK